MEKQKITIHRALAELKLIDARIEKGITDIYPTSITQKDKKIDGYITEQEFKEKAEADFKSINDLITRKFNIKAAIVQSNAKTKVTVGGKELNVSDAISYKTILEAKKKFADNLKAKHERAVGFMNKNNETISKNVDHLLAQAYGKDSMKVSKEDQESISKPYLENNTFRLINPLNVTDKIAEIELSVTSFETDIDAALSESNAITFIEI